MANQISRNELIEKLRNVQGNTQLSQSVRDRITYTLAAFDKTPKQVTNSVLSELANDVSAEIRALAEAQNEQSKAEEAKKPALVENSPKLKSKGKIKPAEKKAEPVEKLEDSPELEDTDEQEDPDEAPAEQVAEKPAEKEKAPAKKPLSKKGKAKSEESKKDAPAKPDPAIHFPETLTHEALGELVSCKGKFLTIQEIRDYVNSDKTLYIASHWNKKMIKQFEYGAYNLVKAPKEFPHDLDILTTVIVCENITRLWAMSVYTEALMRFEEVDLAYTEDSRFAEGLEFEFYIPKSEAAE